MDNWLPINLLFFFTARSVRSSDGLPLREHADSLVALSRGGCFCLINHCLDEVIPCSWVIYWWRRLCGGEELPTSTSRAGEDPPDEVVDTTQLRTSFLAKKNLPDGGSLTPPAA